MEEIWKDIPGYEGLYQASTCGRIKSLPHYTMSSVGKKRKFESRIISQRSVAQGYLQVTLYKSGKSKQCLVHRLILITFTSDKQGLEVNHKDENKTNNHLSNLEWVTSKENCNYGTRNMRLSASKKGLDTAKCCDRIGLLNPNSVKVYALNKDMTINSIYSCYREAGEAIGISESTISRRARHRFKTNVYRGLLWFNQFNLPNQLNNYGSQSDSSC